MTNKKSNNKGLIFFAVIILIIISIVLITSNNKDDKLVFDPKVEKYIEYAALSEISQYATITGTVQSFEKKQIETDFTFIVAELYVSKGDYISKGDMVLKYSESAIEEQLRQVEKELRDLELEFTQIQSGYDYYYINAVATGRIKDIKVSKNTSIDSAMQEYGYIAKISTVEKMKVELGSDIPDVNTDESVDVVIGTNTVAGKVQQADDGQYIVVIDSDKYTIGQNVTLKKGDQILGEGSLTLVDYVNVRGVVGNITNTKVKENDKVEFGQLLFEAKEISNELFEEKEKINDLLNEIELLNERLDAPVIYSEYSGIISEMRCSVNSGVYEGTAYMDILDPEQLYISANVEEMDLRNIEIGQIATISVDAFPEKEYTGTVTRISNIGEQSGSFSMYTVDIELFETQDLLVGMSATGTIEIQKKENVVVVPFEAIHTNEDGETYVILSHPTQEQMDINRENDEDYGTVYVTLGIRGYKYCEIVEGLSDGEGVIVEGLFLGRVE